MQVDAGLDPTSGLLTATFQAIDPGTGLPPTDPTLGFLPPDTAPPAGDGYLTYSVQAKSGLPTGTTINNQAIVYFDSNPAIDTPTWSNTLDNTPPVSQLKPLTKKSAASRIKLKPTGTDVGSGIQDYDIYVSEDGGIFQPLLTHQTAKKDIFIATTGHKYGFFSRARDAAGNLEALKTKAETTVKVVGADLIGSWINVTEKTTAAGKEKIKGSFVVTNQSPTVPTTVGGSVRFYLSADATLDDQDTVIGDDVPFGVLPANGTTTVEMPTLKRPAGSVATGMYIIALIDPAGAVTETDKTNNTVVYGPLP